MLLGTVLHYAGLVTCKARNLAKNRVIDPEEPSSADTDYGKRRRQ